ncbi:MAG: SAM-dependent methyltransferase, partial [Boseongicola sp.]|nr:SAM-dependent methyltransferase [Boseongicola sp.]
MNQAPTLTDRNALTLHRARAVRRPENFLLHEIAVDLQETLGTVNKEFTSPALITAASDVFGPVVPGAHVVEDKSDIDLNAASHDLVVHAGCLHWADDPVGQMVQSRLALIPDGLFLGAMFGGQTLHELRTALAEAETALTGGLSPRVLPMGDVRELGGLLQRAGFALPVADTRTINVTYTCLADLVRDLRGMGESNALAARNRSIAHRELFKLTEHIYRQHFSDPGGRMSATFEVIYRPGGAPEERPPKSLKPGSATT